MTNDEFAQLVLSKVEPGSFVPVALYNPDNDSLEVLISPETYRVMKTNVPWFTVYTGIESEKITGVRIGHVTSLIKDVQNDPPDIRLEVHDGKCKVAHLFRAIQEKAKKERTVLSLVIQKLQEEFAEHDLDDLEFTTGSCATRM